LPSITGAVPNFGTVTGLAFSGGTTNVPFGSGAFVVEGLDGVLVEVRFAPPGTDGVVGAGVEVTTGVGEETASSVALTVAEGTGEGDAGTVGVFASELVLTVLV
jgi:hypothetical protein